MDIPSTSTHGEKNIFKELTREGSFNSSRVGASAILPLNPYLGFNSRHAYSTYSTHQCGTPLLARARCRLAHRCSVPALRHALGFRRRLLAILGEEKEDEFRVMRDL